MSGVSNSSTALEVSELVHAVQYGDFECVKQAVELKKLSPNTCDGEGCSLLHWAAINNRIEIAQFLIKNNANVNHLGGNLKETPLHWCVRNDHYTRMVCLLLFDGKADPAIKSTMGSTPLFIACQHGSLNNAFLLLHYTDINPDTENIDGDTPLYWLFKNQCRDSLDLQRLLLKYNASVMHLDRNGNNALHIIMGLGPKADLYSALMVYEEGQPTMLTTKNNQGQTPIEVCRSKEYDILVTFMEDAWLYTHLPKSFTIVSSAALVVSLLAAFYFLGHILSFPVIVVLIYLWYKSSQSTIVTKLSRQSNGFAWGIIVTIVGSYYIFLADKFSFVYDLLVTAFGITICSTLYLCAKIPPVTLSDISEGNDVSRLAEALIATGYPEGPSSPPLVPYSNLSRTRLCTTCLVDKSRATTHCAQCNMCVVSLDHHCVFVNNCIGLGNRLVFVYFTISASLGCLFYTFLSVYAEYTYYCPYIGEGLNYELFLKEWCMWNVHPTLAIIKTMAFSCSIWIGAIAISQLEMIASESTTYESIKGRHSHDCNCNSHGLNNLIHFFSTGGYKVASVSMEITNYPRKLASDITLMESLCVFDRCRRILTLGCYKLGLRNFPKYEKLKEDISIDPELGSGIISA